VRHLRQHHAAGHRAHGAVPAGVLRSAKSTRPTRIPRRAASTSTITGNQKRETGILGNVNYAGRVEFNKVKYSKDPSTGKRVSRLKPKEQVRTVHAPELRIVPPELWEEVQRVRKLARPGPIRNQRRLSVVRCFATG
jgi:site-specific DNA recombinase